MLPTSQCDDDDAGEVTKLEVTKNLAKKIVASGLQNDAFLLANEDQLMKNCGQLAKYFSEIQPYFGNYNINYVVMNRFSKVGFRVLEVALRKWVDGMLNKAFLHFVPNLWHI